MEENGKEMKRKVRGKWKESVISEMLEGSEEGGKWE